MSAIQAPLAESERLRLLAIMGVDVYVPRDVPLARVAHSVVSPLRPAQSAGEGRSQAKPGTPRVLVGGVRRDEYPQLLAAVLRAARLRSGDWTFAVGAAGRLPEWRFGVAVVGDAIEPAMTFPRLAELRESVPARRGTWHQLRAWLRQR